MNGDIFWHGLRGAKQLKDMRLDDLARLMQHAQTYAPQQPPSADLQLKYLQGIGTGWPKIQRPEVAGQDVLSEPMPIGNIRDPFPKRFPEDLAVNLPEQTLAKPGEMIEAVGDMRITQARIEGQAEGTQAGEKAVTIGEYEPQLIGQQADQIDLYNELLKNLGQDPSKWGTIGGVTGLSRYEEGEGEDQETWGPIQKHPSGYTYQVNKLTGEVRKIDRPPAGTGTGADSDIIKMVKGAQQFVEKFASQSQNSTLQLLATTPYGQEMIATNPSYSAMLKNEVPAQYKELFDINMAILKYYYGGAAAEMGALKPQTQTGGSIQDFANKHGIRIE